MWHKNLLFSLLLLLGAGSVLAGLRQSSRLDAMRKRPLTLAQPDADFQRTVEEVNQQFRNHWAEQQLPFAAPADQLVVARRLSLALTGTIPSLEEIRALESLPPEQRMDWWMDHLLTDRRHADYLAERLARAFVGTDQGPFLVFRRRRFVNWLSDQLAERKPYDVLVRELLAGRGTWTNNPAVNFVTATVDDGTADPIRLAGRTSRAFLGMRIDCLQCHDDFLGHSQLGDFQNPHGGTQRDFHQLAAYFSEVRISPVGVTDQSGKSYRYQYLDVEEEEEISPRPPFSLGDSSANSSSDSSEDDLDDNLDHSSSERGLEANPRKQLAEWVTHRDNRPFARAAVNRMWALLFGRPLVEPIDDIPLLGPFPPGLELLADDFVSHGFDLQRLIRLIAATEVFQLNSQAEFEVGEQHERHWSVFPLTRLRPEQVAGALIQACSLKTIDGRSHFLTQIARFAEGNEFVKRFGDIGEDEFSDRGGTIPQRLLMMNGKVIHERTRDELLTNAATQISKFASTNDQAIQTAYLAVYSRRPDAVELEHFQQRLRDLRGNRHQAAFEDLYWALLNSSEFSWNH
jgi:hypothetical protein